MQNKRVYTFPINGVDAPPVRESELFQQWVDRVEKNFTLCDVRTQAADMVGRDGKRRVLFIKLVYDMRRAGYDPFMGSAFLRGGSVAILEILNCRGKEYAVLTLQGRPAVGTLALPEIPAGMLDGSENFSGTAARELKEEASIEIRGEDLFDMTRAVYGKKWPGVYPSPGACDEFLSIFLDYRYVTKDFLAGLRGKLTGLAEEHERIVLEVVPLGRVPFEAPDAKALSALMLYHTLKTQGKLDAYLRERKAFYKTSVR